MKKQHQKRARKLAKRRTQPKPRGNSNARCGIVANAWRVKPQGNNTDPAWEEMTALFTAGK